MNSLYIEDTEIGFFKKKINYQVDHLNDRVYKGREILDKLLTIK